MATAPAARQSSGRCTSRSAAQCLMVNVCCAVLCFNVLCCAQVTKLCDLAPGDSVCSVSWSQRGTYLSVGTNSGEVQIWDVSKLKRTRTMTGHRQRVGTQVSWCMYEKKLSRHSSSLHLCTLRCGCIILASQQGWEHLLRSELKPPCRGLLVSGMSTCFGLFLRCLLQAWSSHMLASGSRDKSVLLRDVRLPDHYVAKLAGHRSEVCGLKVCMYDQVSASCYTSAPVVVQLLECPHDVSVLCGA